MAEGDEFDSVMNYPFHNAVMNFFRDKETDSRNFQYRINKCYSMYMEQTNQVLFNLLDSHDTDRLIPSDRWKSGSLFPAACNALYNARKSLYLLWDGNRDRGGADPDCRRCMPWDQIEQGNYARDYGAR